MAGSKKRFMKLAGMTASITGKVAKNSFRQLSRDEKTRIEAREQMMKDVGEQIADTLGEMKGAVMKVGQIASQYRDVFPTEVAKSLEKLQKDAPPMAFEVIKNQVEQELDKPLLDAFFAFEQEPFASASIGQVHKALLFDEEGNAGAEVVVKVQYPNIEENIDSDLKQVRLALKLSGVLNISKELQNQLFDEISQNLRQELDYIKEAVNLVKFANFYQNDASIIIPKVISSHSTKRVLTLSMELGESLETAKNWSNDVKKQLATALFHFSAGQLFHLQSMHCDPHPGNFAFRQDGSIVVYDFGGIKNYTDEEVETFKEILGYAINGDIQALERGLVHVGTRKDDDVEIEADFYLGWLEICLRPLSIAPYFQGEFDFSESQLHHEILTNMKSSVKYLKQFQPSAKTMMLDRTVSGQYWNLVNLGVKINLSPLVESYLDNKV